MTSERVEYENVTLETVDQAIHDWLERTVDVHVDHPNGERKRVPVQYSSGERWVTSRQKKGIRDANGVLILPIISFRRTSIDPAPNMSALGAETPNLQISRRIDPKSNTLQNVSKNRGPSHKIAKPVIYEVTTIPFPDRSILNYDINIQTQYIVQMNTILEKIFHQLDIHKSFVAPLHNNNRQPQTGVPFEDRKKMKDPYVVGFFENTVSDGGNLEEFTDQERIVRFSTSIKVPAVLQLDPEGTKPAITVERTAYKVNFGGERVKFVDDPEELDKIFGPHK